MPQRIHQLVVVDASSVKFDSRTSLSKKINRYLFLIDYNTNSATQKKIGVVNSSNYLKEYKYVRNKDLLFIPTTPP